MSEIDAAIIAAGFKGTDESTETGWIEPSAYIQWKGTDVCMDFHCKCGAFCHYDGDFAYIVKCPHCGTLWEMPWVIYPRVAEPDVHWQTEDPKILQADDDHMDDEGNALALKPESP